MTGFVYIWRDRARNRYYIGSHWGPEDDGYICSSRWMRRSHSRRPQDFKRRIISRVTTSWQDLRKEEQRWLDMIKLEELNLRYYNGKRNAMGPWKSQRGMKRTPEFGEAVRRRQLGVPRPQSVKDKISLKKRGLKQTPEHNKNIGLAGKRAWSEGRRSLNSTRAMQHARRKPITVNGVSYPSITAAINALKIPRKTFYTKILPGGSDFFWT